MARRFSTMTATAATTSASPRRSPRSGSDIEVDLSDSDPQSTSFVNSSHANMQAAVAMAFAYLIDAEIPEEHRRAASAEGDRKARHDRLGRSRPAGDAVHQPSLRTRSSKRSSRRLSARVPSARWPAGAGGSGSRSRARIRAPDKNFIWHLFQARPGGGASSGGDGWSSIGEWHTVGGLKFGSIEVAEVRFPLHFRHHEFRRRFRRRRPASRRPRRRRSIWCWRPKSSRRATPPATARATAPAACSAARTASRITIACCPKAASRACCAPRKSASSCVPAIASKYVPPAVAAGDRPKSDRRRRAERDREQGLT